MAEEKNEIIKEANEEVEEILSDEQLKAWNDYLQTAIWEENSRNYAAREEGLKEGRREGIKEGIKQGRERGIKEGKKSEKIEMAKRLKKKGIAIETIIEVTELTEEEIKKIIIK